MTEALSDATVEKKILLAETVAKEAGNKRKVGKLSEEVNQLLASASKTGEQCTKHRIMDCPLVALQPTSPTRWNHR